MEHTHYCHVPTCKNVWTCEVVGAIEHTPVCPVCHTAVQAMPSRQA